MGAALVENRPESLAKHGKTLFFFKSGLPMLTKARFSRETVFFFVGTMKLWCFDVRLHGGFVPKIEVEQKLQLGLLAGMV